MEGTPMILPRVRIHKIVWNGNDGEVWYADAGARTVQPSPADVILAGQVPGVRQCPYCPRDDCSGGWEPAVEMV